MGGCISAPRDGSGVLGDPSDTSGIGVSIGKNQPLKGDRPKWKSDIPLTETQLRSKREEFWDTAPAFEGRKEIWDALKAAAYAMETMDHAMAQAIVDGASISLPHGTLMDCYDELGNRYQLPVYVLSPPTNLIQEPSDTDTNSESEAGASPGTECLVKFRLSSGVDVKLTVRSTDSVLKIKKKIYNDQGIEPSRQRWFFAGKPLHNKMLLEEAKIPRGYVVQVVVAPEPTLPS